MAERGVQGGSPVGWASGRLPRRALVAGILLAVAARVAGAELRVLAPNAVKEAVAAAAAQHERATGDKVTLAWSGTEAITRRVTEGEVVDVVVNAAQNFVRLAGAGTFADPPTDFARSRIGVAVPRGVPAPDIATPETLREALLAARSIAVSSGTSGRHMVEVFARLGIADRVAAKTLQPPSGAQIAGLVARGEADLGFQQVSELRHAADVHYLGPLPAGLQQYTVYSGAVHALSRQSESARAFVGRLRSPEARAATVESGLEPL